MFKCSSGPPVETLDQWKKAELIMLLTTAGLDVDALADFLMAHAADFIAILWLKEKGRPNGAKDKVKRKLRVVADEGKAA